MKKLVAGEIGAQEVGGEEAGKLPREPEKDWSGRPAGGPRYDKTLGRCDVKKSTSRGTVNKRMTLDGSGATCDKLGG